jgi:hypothetical protein
LFAAPLDRSGFARAHLHAAAFTPDAHARCPWLAWLTAPFTVLVPASRWWAR